MSRIACSLLVLALALQTVVLGARTDESRSKAVDYFIRGAVAAEAEDYYRAIFHYQEALRFDSLSPYIHVALAQTYLLVGSVAQAEESIERALDIDSKNLPALELKTVLLRGGNRPQDARETVEALVNQKPDNTNYLRQLLGLQLALKEFGAADKTYARIVAIEGPTDLLIRQVLAVYLAAGEQGRVLKYFRALQEIDTTDASVVYAIGATILQQGDTAEAIPTIEKAIRMEPDNPRFWVGRAAIEFDRREYDRTVLLLDSAVLITGPDANIYNLRGAALNRLGRTSDAISTLQLAMLTDSTMIAPLGTLALIYDGLDSLNLAVSTYERAIRMSDSAAVFLNNLAYTWAARGIRLKEAQYLAQRALDKEPGNPSYMDTMGWIEYGLGNYDAALDLLKAAAKRTPDSAEVLEHLGDVQLKLGNSSRARDAWQRALKRNPDSQSLREKLER